MILVAHKTTALDALFQLFTGRMFKKASPARPQAEQEPEAYPHGYVEDSGEPRTKLADLFQQPD